MHVTNAMMNGERAQFPRSFEDHVRLCSINSGKPWSRDTYKNVRGRKPQATELDEKYRYIDEILHTKADLTLHANAGAQCLRIWAPPPPQTASSSALSPGGLDPAASSASLT